MALCVAPLCPAGHLPSPLHLPGGDALAGRRVLAVFQLDALRQQLITDAVGGRPVFGGDEGEALDMMLLPTRASSISPHPRSKAEERQAVRNNDDRFIGGASRQFAQAIGTTDSAAEIVSKRVDQGSEWNCRNSAPSARSAARFHRRNILRLLQLPDAKIDRLAVMRHQHGQPQHFARPFAAAKLFRLQQFVDGDKIAVDFDIFLPSTWRKPLCIQKLAITSVPWAQRDWAISFSWCGKIRSSPPP
jgi:hypothetical protein